MASASASLPALSVSHLSLLLLLCLLPITISQDPISSSPTVAQCSTSLLPLASCAPFVQGLALTPAISCCDNLKQLYNTIPHCLCLLLNGTALSSFPINTTRALQLPDLCSLQVTISTCSAVLVPPSSPDSQVSPGENTNSTITNTTVAASPMAQPAPKSSIMGLGMGRISAGSKLRVGIEFKVVNAMKTFLYLALLY